VDRTTSLHQSLSAGAPGHADPARVWRVTPCIRPCIRALELLCYVGYVGCYVLVSLGRVIRQVTHQIDNKRHDQASMDAAHVEA
jgi:hypothetical protein